MSVIANPSIHPSILYPGPTRAGTNPKDSRQVINKSQGGHTDKHTHTHILANVFKYILALDTLTRYLLNVTIISLRVNEGFLKNHFLLNIRCNVSK